MFEFARIVRTPYSEGYAIFFDGKNIGNLDIHILNHVNSTLIVQSLLKNNELEELISKIDSEIISGVYPREDFILTVYFGKEVGFYSDVISEEERSWHPVVKRDFEDISGLIKTTIGKAQNAKGKLNEFVVIKFFKKLGYEAIKASRELDHQKIDIIAKKDGITLFVQVKLGQISENEIRNLVNSIAGLNYDGVKLVGVVANVFPNTSELIRDELENEFNLKIHYYHKYQVLNVCPEYKNSLK